MNKQFVIDIINAKIISTMKSDIPATPAVIFAKIGILEELIDDIKSYPG